MKCDSPVSVSEKSRKAKFPANNVENFAQKPKHTCMKALWKLLPKTDGCVCPYQHNYTNVIQQMALAGKTLKKKKSTPNKRNDISCIIKIKSVSTKSTRSRRTNAITAASLVLRTACYARRSPLIPPFQRKPAPQTALPLLTAVFLFKVSLRRHMSACVTNFKNYSFSTV